MNSWQSGRTYLAWAAIYLFVHGLPHEAFGVRAVPPLVELSVLIDLCVLHYAFTQISPTKSLVVDVEKRDRREPPAAD